MTMIYSVWMLFPVLCWNPTNRIALKKLRMFTVRTFRIRILVRSTVETTILLYGIACFHTHRIFNSTFAMTYDAKTVRPIAHASRDVEVQLVLFWTCRIRRMNDWIDTETAARWMSAIRSPRGLCIILQTATSSWYWIICGLFPPRGQFRIILITTIFSSWEIFHHIP